MRIKDDSDKRKKRIEEKKKHKKYIPPTQRNQSKGTSGPAGTKPKLDE